MKEMAVISGKLRIVTPTAGTWSDPMTGPFCRNNLRQEAEFFFLSPVGLTPSCVTWDAYLSSLFLFASV